ncbi:MAG: L-2-amino-thiazoline-4-carboxylic acid hydrolase [Clostridia bacterium]
MSNIVNEPKNKLKLLQTIRGQLEQRAIWLAVLSEEAKKNGVDIADFGREAIFKCGCMQGKDLAKGSNNLKDLKKGLFSKGARMVFEMDIKESTEDKLSIDFHYCPLVKGWQKMGLSDEEIARLCDVAMCGDRGIASQFGAKLNLEKVIAKGDPICQIRFVRDEKK